MTAVNTRSVWLTLLGGSLGQCDVARAVSEKGRETSFRVLISEQETRGSKRGSLKMFPPLVKIYAALEVCNCPIKAIDASTVKADGHHSVGSIKKTPG